MSKYLLSLLLLVAPVVMAQEESAAAPDVVPAVTPETTEKQPESGETVIAEELNPRDRYNLALGMLEAGETEAAAKEFLSARDDSGPDPELRYRAAFNLAVALAGQSDTQQEEAPEQAIELLRSSAAWFSSVSR